jgi:hypothetical protein
MYALLWSPVVGIQLFVLLTEESSSYLWELGNSLYMVILEVIGVSVLLPLTIILGPVTWARQSREKKKYP